jgi:hypothetical protein
MSKNDNPPIYIATDEFLAELRELGYEASIELDDLIDFLDEDPSYIEQMRPAMMMFDEMNYLSPGLQSWLYGMTMDARPT